MLELGGTRAARSSACSPTWTSRSGARSATRSRSPRRATRSAARGRRTSPSSCSTRARAASRSPTSGSTRTREAARRGGVADGSALAVYERWIRAQGGDPIRPRCRGTGRHRGARAAGRLRVRLGAIAVGIAALHLGAGRRDEGGRDRPLPSASSATQARRERRRGDVLAEVHARDEESGEEASRPSWPRTSSATSLRASIRSCSTSSRDRSGRERRDDERELAALIDAAFGTARRRSSRRRSARRRATSPS
jgi:hypothetical protein